MPQSAFDTELKNATNYWLSADNIQNLVLCYLKGRLEADQEYILGTKALKKLRLSQKARMALLDDLQRAGLPRNEVNRGWRKWLESGEQLLDITFESSCWKDNPAAALISITHPLARLAAAYFQSKGKFVTRLRVVSKAFAAGAYPFAIYQWKLSGEREDVQIVPISANPSLNNALFDLLKQSQGLESPTGSTEDQWADVESIHHDVWLEALKAHKRKTDEMISYKEASLRTSHAARMAVLRDNLENNRDNKKYAPMISGKIRIAQEDYEAHIQKLQRGRQSADILFELLAYGILVIENSAE